MLELLATIVFVLAVAVWAGVRRFAHTKSELLPIERKIEKVLYVQGQASTRELRSQIPGARIDEIVAGLGSLERRGHIKTYPGKRATDPPYHVLIDARGKELHTERTTTASQGGSF